MIKLVRLIKRLDGATLEEFRSWWINDHAPLARQLPGLRRYVLSISASDANGDYDGMAELWFDDADAAKAAFEGDVGKKVVADALAHAKSRTGLATLETEVL